MAELKNYAEIRFVNAVLIDIFGHYAGNPEMAEIVAPDGTVHMKFKVNPPVDPPRDTEQLLSLMFALLESNGESSMGKVYIKYQREILRETIYRLSQVIDSFSDVRMSLHTSVPGSDGSGKEIESHTEFTLTRRSHSHTDNK